MSLDFYVLINMLGKDACSVFNRTDLSDITITISTKYRLDYHEVISLPCYN